MWKLCQYKILSFNQQSVLHVHDNNQLVTQRCSSSCYNHFTLFVLFLKEMLFIFKITKPFEHFKIYMRKNFIHVYFGIFYNKICVYLIRKLFLLLYLVLAMEGTHRRPSKSHQRVLPGRNRTGGLGSWSIHDWDWGCLPGSVMAGLERELEFLKALDVAGLSWLTQFAASCGH